MLNIYLKGIIKFIFDNLSRGKLDKDFKILLKKKCFFYKINLNSKIKIKLKNISHIFHLAGSVGVKNINKDAYGSFSTMSQA